MFRISVKKWENNGHEIGSVTLDPNWWLLWWFIVTGSQWYNNKRLSSGRRYMMTSSNGTIFRVTGPLCGDFTGEFPTQRPVTRSFDVFFDLRVNKRLSKHSWGWWFETPESSLWRHCNDTKCVSYPYCKLNPGLTACNHWKHGMPQISTKMLKVLWYEIPLISIGNQTSLPCRKSRSSPFNLKFLDTANYYK